MSIGGKQHKSFLKLGIKSYRPIFNFGMKSYFNHLNHSHNNEQSKLSHSNNEGISNTSNSVDAHREPMTYNNFTPKDYVKNIARSSIERARKKSSQKRKDNFI